MPRPARLARPDPGTRDEALGAFRKAVLMPHGAVVETRHFKERMAQRRFDQLDVVNLAYTGRISRPPTWDAKHQEWKWRVEGRAVDDRPIAEVFTVIEPLRVKAVTIMGRRR